MSSTIASFSLGERTHREGVLKGGTRRNKNEKRKPNKMVIIWIMEPITNQDLKQGQGGDPNSPNIEHKVRICLDLKWKKVFLVRHITPSFECQRHRTGNNCILCPETPFSTGSISLCMTNGQ